MKKTLACLIESYGGLFCGIIFGLVTFFIIKPDIFLKDKATFVIKISDLGFIIFGFLLAFIGLITNMKDKLVKAHGSDMIFKRTIGFNIRIIKISVLLGTSGFVLWAFYQSQNQINSTLSNILLSVFSLVIGWMFYDLIYFVRIFFKLIRGYS